MKTTSFQAAWFQVIRRAVVVSVVLSGLNLCHGLKLLAQEPSAKAVKPWTAQRLDKLLSHRLDGGLGSSFGAFANMFLVRSRIDLPVGVGLMTRSKEISKSELMPAFPPSYKPTLRELLDMVSLQTSSTWKYDPSGKFIKSDPGVGQLDSLVIFEFAKTTRAKPFEVTLPPGWKSNDRGNWVMFSPPDFPLAVDIHELGTYSADKKEDEPALLAAIPIDVAIQWAKRTGNEITRKDLKAAKAGQYDAWFYECMFPTRMGKDVHWRQWTFMVDSRCYFFVSTVFPDREKTLSPQVEAVVKSFKIKDANKPASGAVGGTGS